MEKQFHKKFGTCPGTKQDGTPCGGTHRFMEELGKELKTRGFARPEWNLRYDVREGVPTDKNFRGTMPVGTMLPGFEIMTDICMDCGTLYAVELRRVENKGEVRRSSGLQLPNQQPPTHPFSNS
ncbi:hypothetical protein LCGC14_1214200 [marine sediment metagenome]|uniref:Uncharacterized protein n=1 Tax=marine sediment metagenome TaxID=412755 RepID=A0A0F9LHB2_9ZZZZ